MRRKRAGRLLTFFTIRTVPALLAKTIYPAGLSQRTTLARAGHQTAGEADETGRIKTGATLGATTRKLGTGLAGR